MLKINGAGALKMVSRTEALKVAYAALTPEKKEELTRATKIEKNSFAYIEDAAHRKKKRQDIIEKITHLLDELESKCGDDAFFYGVPRHDSGVNQRATSRAQYALLKMGENNFSKNFVISCAETVDRLRCFDLDTLRSMCRRLMHSLMSKSKFFCHTILIIKTRLIKKIFN